VFTLTPPREKEFAGASGVVVPSVVASAGAAAPAIGVSTATVAPPAEPEGPATARVAPPRGSDERAKRLARVLVSDILCYNREKRDSALLDGDLMTALGDEIKKSWELYKQKVGPELANSTDYFKEALNEILANGQKLF
jgi:hypothetical protein